LIDRAARALVSVIALVVMAGSGARAQVAAPASGVSFLDVPYLSQTEALCGGAAAAMVMRYWGAVGIDAETFAPLLDRTAGGIHGADLAKYLAARGWEARTFAGDRALVAARLRDRQPVIALIEDRAGAFHYVVIVAWASGRVVVHDSARTPFRVISEAAFEAAWQKSGRWTLLVLPGAGKALSPLPSPDAITEAEVPRSGCERLIDHAMAALDAKDQAEAVASLDAAAQLCPGDSAPLRELAGVYALQEKWAEASTYASDAVRRNANDEHAWRILATSRFILGDMPGALTAWNHLREPVIDIVNVQGLDRTRYVAATNSMRLRPGELLGVDELTAAGHRLAALPSAQIARVNYRPLENGRTAVDAVVIERPHSPFTLGSLATNAVSAAADSQVSLAIASPTGAGDLVSGSWRWSNARPMIGLSYSTPVRIGGVVRADVFRDEQSYTSSGGGVLTREVRRGGGVFFSDWTTRGFRWELGLGADAWSDRGRAMNFTAGIDSRHLRDRLSLRADVTALAGAFAATVGQLSANWRSGIRNEGSVLLSTMGVEAASDGAPRALWAGAGTGYARAPLLRAHPLLDDGVITGDVFGRRLYHASTEWRRWWPPILRFVRAAPAIFVDAARAEQRAADGAAWNVDGGIGLRVAVPGSGVLRLDVGRGMRDGATAFSIAWVR
jgi:hypothetical protein